MKRWIGLVSVVVLGACNSADISGTSRMTEGLATSRRIMMAKQTQWLSIGTRVAANVALTALPEPYSVARYGPLLPPTVRPMSGRASALAIAAHTPPGHPPRGAGAQAFPSPYIGNRGYYVDQVTKAWWGIYTVNDIGTSISLDSGFVYAPTTLAPGESCIEMTMAHWREGSQMRHELWSFDWCKGDAGVGVLPDSARWDLTDSTFADNYIRTYNGRSTVVVDVVTPNTGSTPGQCWYFNIYNFNVGGYQQLYYSCGSSRLHDMWGTTGWSMWEEHFVVSNSSCPAVASVGASAVSFGDPTLSDWRPVSNYSSDHWTLGGSQYCWSGGGYSWTSPVTGASSLSWRAHTPN